MIINWWYFHILIKTSETRPYYAHCSATSKNSCYKKMWTLKTELLYITKINSPRALSHMWNHSQGSRLCRISFKKSERIEEWYLMKWNVYNEKELATDERKWKNLSLVLLKKELWYTQTDKTKLISKALYYAAQVKNSLTFCSRNSKQVFDTAIYHRVPANRQTDR